MRDFLAVLLMILAPLPSVAATVTSSQGQTLLNGGNGYRLVQGPTQAGTGASVVVNQGSVGLVTYDDGCAVPVAPGQIYTILAVSPCQSGNNQTPAVNGLAVGAAIIGGTVGAIILSKGLSSASP